jgi:hypothetical protein
MEYWKASNREIQDYLESVNAEEYYGETMPDPDEYDESEESEMYAEKRELLEEWAAEMIAVTTS